MTLLRRRGRKKTPIEKSTIEAARSDRPPRARQTTREASADVGRPGWAGKGDQRARRRMAGKSLRPRPAARRHLTLHPSSPPHVLCFAIKDQEKSTLHDGAENVIGLDSAMLPAFGPNVIFSCRYLLRAPDAASTRPPVALASSGEPSTLLFPLHQSAKIRRTGARDSI